MLQSNLFANDARLEQCAVQDSAHLTLVVIGEFVSKVQLALQLIEGATIEPAELLGKRYGPSTAKSILTFKQKRSIINPAYQRQADDIVGKMTIARLDAEMVEHERRSVPPPPVPPPSPIPPKPRPLEFE